MFKNIGLSTLFSIIFCIIYCVVFEPEGDLDPYVFNSIFFGVVIGLLLSITCTLNKEKKQY